ncbi:MAG TPA: NAD-dependent dehydratase, partial [Methylophaga sp.]|nr:NAD-dependent dehydratase [Methylophaga sp.]
MKLLLVGATGLVGSHVLKLALNDQRISRVVV